MTTTNENNNLETLLSNDPDGTERDKLMRILQDLEQEMENRMKQGCSQDEYKQVSVVANGARVAQAVLQDYHERLNQS